MQVLRGVTISITLAAITAVLILLIASNAAGALSIHEGVQSAHGAGQPTELFGSSGIITTITNTLLFIVGALSVIMIIFGGLRYVLSGGNGANVTAAKNTILYAIVGLLVAFFAYAIINWILGSITGTGSSGFVDA